MSINNDLFLFPTVDLTEPGYSSRDLYEALLPLFQPGIADGSVYWAESCGCATRGFKVVPRGDRVLTVSLSSGGNEGWQLIISACMVGR